MGRGNRDYHRIGEDGSASAGTASSSVQVVSLVMAIFACGVALGALGVAIGFAIKVSDDVIDGHIAPDGLVVQKTLDTKDAIIATEASSNIYLGMGDDPVQGGLDNARRAWRNTDLTSRTVQDLQLFCRFDVAALIGKSFIDGARIAGGPLGTLQVDEDKVYATYGNTAGFKTISGSYTADPDDQPNDHGGILAIFRRNCTLAWHKTVFEIQNAALPKVAAKYPGLYDAAAVQAYLANGGRKPGKCSGLAPLAVLGDYIITADTCPGIDLYTPEYFASLPQANGGPVINKTWGVTNANRHLIRGQIFLIHRANGQLLSADHFTDIGQTDVRMINGQMQAATGYANPTAIGRMTTPFIDPNDGKTYVISTTSHPQRLPWGLFSNNETEVEVAIANGNVDTRGGGRITKFEIRPNATSGGADLVEIWRTYGARLPLEEGDVNPYEPSETFATRHEAEKRNSHSDGIWGQRPMVDLPRRQVVIAGGNAMQQPAEEIVAAAEATGTTDPITSATGYPNRPYRDWYLLFNAAGSSEEMAAIHRDYVQTQKDRLAAIRGINGSSIDQFACNAVMALDIGTGKLKWTYRRVATDTWTSLSFVAQTFSEVPEFIKAQYGGGGGDTDYAQGVIHVRDPELGIDTYVALAKDGTAQRLDPDTGAAIYDLKYGQAALTGAFTYQATTDGRVITSGIQGTRTLDFLGDKNHATVYNGTEFIFDVIEQLSGSPSVFGNLTATTYAPYSVRDTYGEFGGVAGQLQNAYPAGIPLVAGLPAQKTIVTFDALTGRELRRVTTSPATATQDGSTTVTSANDVVFSTLYDGRFAAWNSETFELLWVYDTTSGLIGVPNYPATAPILTTSPPVPAGKEVWATQGETGFTGNYPGKYIYGFKLQPGSRSADVLTIEQVNKRRAVELKKKNIRSAPRYMTAVETQAAAMEYWRTHPNAVDQ